MENTLNDLNNVENDTQQACEDEFNAIIDQANDIGEQMIQGVSDVGNLLLGLALSIYDVDLEFLRTASIEELEEKYKTEESKDLIAFANNKMILREIGPVAASNLKIAEGKILRNRGYDEDRIQILNFLCTADTDEMEEKFKTYETEDLISFANNESIMRAIGSSNTTKLHIAVRSILVKRGFTYDYAKQHTLNYDDVARLFHEYPYESL